MIFGLTPWQFFVYAALVVGLLMFFVVVLLYKEPEKPQPEDPNIKRIYGPWVEPRDDPFANSPFNKDVITKDDPAWTIFEAAKENGGAVVGTYDAVTGEITSIEPVDSYQARHDAIDDIQNHSLSPKPEEES